MSVNFAEATTPFSKFTTAHAEQLDKVNEAIMARDFSPIRNIYIDLVMLKDFRLGLMLALSDQDQRQYLIDGIDRYNNRFDLSFRDTAYPEFKYKEEDLQRFILDPVFQTQAFNFAPDTEMSYYWTRYIATVDARNRTVQYRGDVNIYVNCYPLSPIEIVQQFMRYFQFQFDENVYKCKLISKSPDKLDRSFWEGMDVIYVDNIQQLCQDGSPWQESCKNLKFLNKLIISPPQISKATRADWIEKGLDLSDPEKVMEYISITAAVISLCCDFKFIRFPIPKPGEIQPPQTPPTKQ